MNDPMILLHTALALQSSVPEAHSSVSKSKFIWDIDQARGQDGWISAKFFFFARLWNEAQSRSIYEQKENDANIKPYWPNNLV